MNYASFSKNAPEKPRNGGYCRIFEHESGAIIAIIADGSGADPCDWKAAETAGKVIEATIEPAATVDKALMIAAIKDAGKAVAEIFGLCSGAKTSLGMVVLEKTGIYRLINLGDSKIFHFNGSDLSAQITGQNDSLLGEKLPELVVLEGLLNKKEGIVLLSRGVVGHNGRAFLPDFRYLFSKANPENNLPVLMERYLQGQQEDLTVVFVVNG